MYSGEAAVHAMYSISHIRSGKALATKRKRIKGAVPGTPLRTLRSLYLSFANKEVGAQRSEITCPELHSR